MSKINRAKCTISLLIVMLLILGACGGGGTPPANSGGTPPAVSGGTDSGASGSADSGGAIVQGDLAFEERDPLRVGVICPLTGSRAFAGLLVNTSVELAQKQINEGGGIQGHPVEFFVENDEFTTPLSVAAAQKLIMQNEVHLLNGPFQSGGVAAVQELTEEAEIPHVSSCGSAANLTENNAKWFFRLTLSDADQSVALVDLVTDRGLSKVAILAESGSHGAGNIESWTRDLAQKGLEPIIIERFEDADLDFTAQLHKVKAAAPDTIVIAALQSQSSAIIIKQAKELDIQAQYIISSSVAGSYDYINLAGSACEGVIGPCSFLPNNPDPIVQKYVADFATLSSDVPEGQHPSQAYDVYMILFEYMNQKNADGSWKFPLGFDDANLAADRDQIRQAYTTVKGYHGATGIEVNFGPELTPADRDGIKKPLIAEIIDGTWVTMPDYN